MRRISLMCQKVCLLLPAGVSAGDPRAVQTLLRPGLDDAVAVDMPLADRQAAGLTVAVP